MYMALFKIGGLSAMSSYQHLEHKIVHSVEHLNLHAIPFTILNKDCRIRLLCDEAFALFFS